VGDDDVVTNPEARKPKHAVAAARNIIIGLGRAAILANYEAAAKTVTCVIDSNNPKRINLQYTSQISGNTQITDIQNNWGFFYGTAAAAA
jgi:hypothetical protein